MTRSVITEAQKVEKAYGGCHLCYGKGYSTVMNDPHLGTGKRWLACKCPRGKQFNEAILASEKLLIGVALEMLPEFMDEHYPKGRKERGAITTGITLFLIDLKNQL